MNPLLPFRAFDINDKLITSANNLNVLINVPEKPACIEHWSDIGTLLGTYTLARPGCVKSIDCYDYESLTRKAEADSTFVDPYDAQVQPLPPLHSRTPPMESRGHIDAGLHVSIVNLQAIALSLQLQIRAQRKQDESLYNADTITEHEWKARRHHNTVLSNTVQQMLSLAELKAITLDTPLKGTPAHDTSNNSTICNCGHCQALRND